MSALERQKLRVNLLDFCSSLNRGSTEGGPDPFSLGSTERTHWNGSKGHQGRFRLEIREHFFTKTVVRHWNRLARKVVDAPRPSMF